MGDPVAVALLVVLAAAYLGGAVLVVTGLGKILLVWWAAWRARMETVSVDDALRAKATAATNTVAAAAGVATPATEVVAILGSPTGTDQPHAVGTGGLAVTRFRRGRPPTVVFTQASLTGLSDAALQSLAAHELAHVIRHRESSTPARYAWLAGYLLLVAAGVGLTITAMLAAPQLAGPALLATMVAVVAFLALRVAFERREEIAADLFAIGLTRDLDAAAELMNFLEENVSSPLPAGRLAGGWAQLERRWFAAHPEPRARLAAMSRRLGS